MLEIGDRVIITDSGYCYTSYKEWADRFNLNWNGNFSNCIRGDKGIIKNKGQHSERDKRIIYGVTSESTGYDFIIDQRGMKKIKYKKMLDDNLFEI